MKNLAIFAAVATLIVAIAQSANADKVMDQIFIDQVLLMKADSTYVSYHGTSTAVIANGRGKITIFTTIKDQAVRFEIIDSASSYGVQLFKYTESQEYEDYFQPSDMDAKEIDLVKSLVATLWQLQKLQK